MGKHFISRSVKTTMLIIVFVLIGYIYLFQIYTSVHAEGGIAISGSFNRYHYKTVPGETVSTPDVDIVVHNKYNMAIKMKFAVEAPKDVSVDLEGKQFVIPANGSSTFPVTVSVGKSVVPGTYEIGVSAEPLPDTKSGIAVLGGAQLRTKLSVFGEAGRVKVNVVDPEGEPFVNGEIKLFKKEGNNITSVGYGRGDTMEERVAVGEYTVKVFYQGDEVGQSSFYVKKDETKEITIQAKTVFIQGFSVTPQYKGKSKEVSSARVTYTLKNVYKPVKGVRVVLKVYYEKAAGLSGLFSELNPIGENAYASSSEGSLLEEAEVSTYPTLEIGSQSGRYVYVPVDKWKKGVYKFALTVYGVNSKSPTKESVVYGQTENIELKNEGSNSVLYIIVILIIVIILALIAVYIIRKKKWLRRKTK